MLSQSDISILYVEDEDAIRQLYVPFINKRTNKLYVGENGKKGLALYKKHKKIET